MDAMVLGTGLVNRVIGREHQYLGGPDHVGRRESARLLGDGGDCGNGPLPTLLRVAAAATRVGIALVAGRGPGIEEALVEPVAACGDLGGVIPSPRRGLPWRELDGLIGSETGRFLVVGCHTEHEVAGVASMLRSLRPEAEVAVSPHLSGTATVDAHFAWLRHGLPLMGIEVLLDFEEVLQFLGLPEEPFTAFLATQCPIQPEDICESLGDTRRRIVQSLSMHLTRTSPRPLGGGYSGSALFLAEGWKGDSRTEPMVVKIDSIPKMRSELDGYHEVKDFLGKHVPSFGYPVRRDGLLGVGMELAAMEGRPETLQETFESASTEEAAGVFLRRLERALEMLGDRLYRNTRSTGWVVPYRAFEMHSESQIHWLEENGAIILGYLAGSGLNVEWLHPGRLAQLLRVVGSNPDGLEGEMCVTHGDLNYANIISDGGDNLWFIDWTLSRTAPLAMDFAKLENDVKFVISKDFEIADIERLRMFEDYLLANRLPGDVAELPDGLRFVRWDLRYRKILAAIRSIRQAWLGLEKSPEWLVYRVALLRYATHTLSWDLRRGRGECDVPQLLYAFHSVEMLLTDLVADDFHLKIRAERPPGYPERHRISIDQAPWAVECPVYRPPYYVSEAVMAADRSRDPDGWADPEDITLIADELEARPAEFRDGAGRPLNPRGRTGISGRGALGKWGANRSSSVVCVRRNPASGKPDVLLGAGRNPGELEIAKGFVRNPDSPAETAERILELETGQSCTGELEPPVFDGYIYDPRQTDHAWVHTCAFLLDMDPTGRLDTDRPGNPFSDLRWWPLDAATVNRVPPVQAGLIREAVRRMAGTGRMDADDAVRLLAATG